MRRPHLATVDALLAPVPGLASVWCGHPGRPTYQHDADAVHVAASTMKLAVLLALYRAGLDLDRGVTVHNAFTSALGPGTGYACTRRWDSDDEVWQRIGTVVPLGWLAERMIVRSSNLATNLVLAEVGLPAVAAVLDRAGTRHTVIARGIEDTPAAEAGLANETTAADLAALLAAVQADDRAESMLEILVAQQFRDDLPAGLPPGTRVALKNGWIRGVRHSAGIVFPDDAEPFVLAVCLTTPLAVNRHGDEACQLVGRIAAAVWADRQLLE